VSYTRIANGKGVDDWRDDGPSVASSHRPTYSTRNAEPVGSMIPNVVYPLRGSAHIEPVREARTKTRCSVVMPLVGEPCARTPGHRDCHRTAEWMAIEAMNRSNRGNRSTWG